MRGTRSEDNLKKYKLYQAFVLDNFTMSVKESYITNVDYLRYLLSNNQGKKVQVLNFNIHLSKDFRGKR